MQFTGRNDTVSMEKIKLSDSPDLNNVFSDSNANIKLGKGHSTGTSIDGSLDNLIRSLHQFSHIQEGNTYFAEISNKIYYSYDLTTWTRLYDTVTPTDTFGTFCENYRLHSCVHLGKLYLCNGYNDMYTFDGVDFINLGRTKTIPIKGTVK